MKQLNKVAFDLFEPFLVQLLAEGGVDFFNEVVLELRWSRKSDPADSSDDEERKKEFKASEREQLRTLLTKD